MRVRYAFVGGLVCVGLVAPLSAQAAPVHVDLSSVFNADVIVNGTTGNIDSTQSPVDNVSYSLATQGALEAGCVADPVQGLPNNGFFASNANHPNVQLAYRNSKNGKNAVRLEADEKVSFDIPLEKYRRIHLLATSGDGPSSVKVTFKYRDNSTAVKNFVIGDWFQAPAAGTYSLIEGMDRMTPDGTTCDESPHEFSTAHVFGKSLVPNEEKTLKKMTVTRVLSADYSILNIFGVTGSKA